MSKRFKLKQRPTKPRRVDRPRYVYVTDGDTLKELLDALGSTELSKVTFNEGYDGDYSFRWTELETDETLAARITTYELRMAEYLVWHEENKEAIDKERSLRAKLRDQQIAKSKETRKKDIRKEILQLKKEQKRLELEEKS